MSIILESQYFPCLAYFCALLSVDVCLIDLSEHYEKQSYRNRCKIIGAAKIQTLSIPIKHATHKQAIKDTKIDYHENWVNVHWRSIETAYRKAPFFEFYADSFKKALYKKPVFLADLNINILTDCLDFLHIQTEVQYAKHYIDAKEQTDLEDLRSKIHPKKENLILQYYQPKSYQQVFGSKFETNLSILDLLFCEGNNSLTILEQSLANKAK